MKRVTRQHINTAFRFVLVGLLALMLGCPQTNKDLYAELEPGETTLQNNLSHFPIWLGGCNAFEQQRLQNGQWIRQGGDIPCLWEGLASPLAPGAIRIDAFTARSPGTWRLAYPIGFDCRPDQPLNPAHCKRVTQVVTNEFEVGNPEVDAAFCTDTGGTWYPGSCGDYVCGSAPLCLALVPGCDCGPDENFVSGLGCVEDPICEVNNGGQQALCEDTGGLWDPLSCGHYSCGDRPDCAAAIPGCNCGPTAIFDEVFGCLDVPCGAPQDE